MDGALETPAVGQMASPLGLNFVGLPPIEQKALDGAQHFWFVCTGFINPLLL
jgi:hypothetical protein